MPFKTKLTPNFKMDWGKTYPKATYPARQKKEVQLFDIKEYVKNMKKEKMDSMMSNATNNPFGGGNSPFNPFGGASNPFGGSNPFMTPPAMNNSTSTSDNGFNIDDLVKKIDAKIAELEEEEKKENENNKVIDVKENVKEEPKQTIINNEDKKEDILSSIEREYSELSSNNNSTGPMLDIPTPSINNPLSDITYDDIKEKGLFDDLANTVKEAEKPKQEEPKQENKI